MHLNQIYPRFTVTDAHNRALKYSRRGDKFYREWLNPTLKMDKTYLKREISRSQYAYGLLAAVEMLVDGHTLYAPDVREDAKTEADRDLEEWFGPKKGRD